MFVIEEPGVETSFRPMKMKSRKQIIIIGGGFAGLKVARCLNNTSYDVLLIDKVNHHQFQPLFYQVATAGLEPSNISFPLRGIFHHSKNVRIRMAEVQKILPSENKIITSDGEYSFDYLILATGAATNFFGNKNIEQFALPMKSTSDAIEIRQRILKNFEKALTASADDVPALLNIVIVGGGPTGVELAGALAEMKKHVLWKDYPEVDFSKMHIMLIEGSPRTLGAMSETASAKSKQYLEEMGVEVWTNTTVKDYDGQNATLSDGRTVATKNLIWAAGVQGNVIEGLNPELIQRGNRIMVDRFNHVIGYDNIFAIGDLAYMTTPKYPNAHPQVANVAINQAKTLCRNLISTSKAVGADTNRGRKVVSEGTNNGWSEFEYHDKGSLATVGKHKAVVDLPYIKFQGFFAWFVWMGLHLVLLMGMKNRLFVFINWVTSYFSNNSTLRLIFKRNV
jgi:NADH dehydrogenase